MINNPIGFVNKAKSYNTINEIQCIIVTGFECRTEFLVKCRSKILIL